MDHLRSVVTRIIMAYIEIYGEEAVLGEEGDVIIEGEESL